MTPCHSLHAKLNDQGSISSTECYAPWTEGAEEKSFSRAGAALVDTNGFPFLEHYTAEETLEPEFEGKFGTYHGGDSWQSCHPNMLPRSSMIWTSSNSSTPKLAQSFSTSWCTVPTMISSRAAALLWNSLQAVLYFPQFLCTDFCWIGTLRLAPQ